MLTLPAQVYNRAKGLMIRNANESNSSCFKVFNSREWGSSQNSSQMPYVTLSWNAPTPSGISNNGVYYFQNVCSGKYLDVYNADTANNTNLIQFGLTGNANQRFKLERDSSGYYRILAQHTSLKRVLLLNTSNQVVLSDDCSSERALWRIKDEGSGQYSFINKANEGTYAYAMSNMGSGSSGAQIKGESYTNTTRLRWRLLKKDLVTTITFDDGITYTVIGEDFEIEDERPATFTGTHVYANSKLLEHVQTINGLVYVCLADITPWLGLSVPNFSMGSGDAYLVETTHTDVSPHQSYSYSYPYTQLNECPEHGNHRFMISLDRLLSDLYYTQLGKVSQISYRNGAKEIFIQGPGYFVAGQNHVSPLDYIASIELSLIPGVGDIKDLVESVSGEDFITGDSLTDWERVLSFGCALLPVVSYSGINATADGIKGITKIDEILDTADGLTDAARATLRSNLWDKYPPLLRGKYMEIDYAKHILKETDGWFNIGQTMNGYYPVIDFVKKTGSTASTISMKTLDPRCISYMINGTPDINKIKNAINRYAVKYANSKVLIEG